MSDGIVLDEPAQPTADEDHMNPYLRASVDPRTILPLGPGEVELAGEPAGRVRRPLPRDHVRQVSAGQRPECDIVPRHRSSCRDTAPHDGRPAPGQCLRRRYPAEPVMLGSELDLSLCGN